MIWVGVVLVVALAFVALAIYGTEKLLSLARPSVRPTPSGYGVPFEDVTFSSADGVTLRGWFFPREEAPVIVYCPGRGEGLNDFDFRFAPVFYHGGYQVLMFDWRGMGASAGRSSMGYWEQLDLKAAVAYVQKRAISAKIGAMGTSFGAAVIFLSAGAIPELRAVAGECAFATFEGMIASGMHVLYRAPLTISKPLASLIARLAAWRRRFPLHDVDPVGAIHRISPRAVFVIHGTDDHHIPVSSARALYAAAGDPKTLWLIPTAHTEGLAKLGGEYSQRLLAFFDRWLKMP